RCHPRPCRYRHLRITLTCETAEQAYGQDELNAKQKFVTTNQRFDGRDGTSYDCRANNKPC
ncbi:MAG TPA: hypothetical protein PKA58_02045, partial [Polyangium sp.]|nr:hypothetical protein [Polyangium sp.]